MFVDEVSIIVKGGHGGPGRASFYPIFRRGPDGGDGGRGGDLYIQTTSDLTALRNFKPNQIIEAENGQPGGKNRSSGHNGQDKTIILPVGSVIKVDGQDEILELTQPNQSMLFCKGGIGGLGNAAIANSRNTTPKRAQGGRPGEEKHLTIHLKLIADFGLVGLPNAGKSSLLNTLTNAQARVGDYAFTTLEPSLGVYKDKIIADIPGLIEGASTGKGLGVKFLKHIEKTSTLLHCIDSASLDVLHDYKVIRTELEEFNQELGQKQEVILVTKSDQITESKQKEIAKLLKKTKKRIMFVSIIDDNSLEKVKRLIAA